MKFDLKRPVNVDGITFTGSFETVDPYFSSRIQEELAKQAMQIEGTNGPGDTGQSEAESRSTPI